MNQELARIEERLQQLEQAVAALNRRMRALEAGVPTVTGTESANEPGAAPPTTAPAVTSEVSDLSALLSLAGRTFIVFGGAFLLRALTSSGQLHRGVGIVVGLIYAVAWLAVADRAAAGGRRLSSSFHGVAAIMIGFPLLWEASTRFGFLSPPASAGALAALTGLALAVARRRRLRLLAGLAMLGGLVTTLGLVATTGQFIPFTLMLTLIGVATLWLGYDPDWYWLGWLPAFVVDGVLAGMAIAELRAESVERPGTVLATQAFFLAVYLGSVAARTLLRRRAVIPFEVVQTLAAITVGLGGAVAVAHASGSSETAIGVASAILGGGSYAAAFACSRSRRELRVNFDFYATLALVLTLIGGGVLLRGATLAVLLAGLAVLTAWLGHRLSRSALAMHSAAYGVVAAGVSGLISLVATVFMVTPAADWGILSPSAWITLTATALCVAVPRADSSTKPSVAAGVPRVVLALLLVLESSGALVASIAPALAGVPPNAGILATLRTAVLAAAAVLLACARRYERTAELGWLLYPVLCAGGLKLLLEDFRYSEPSMLFVALGLFGAALLAAARLVKRGA